MVGTVIGLYIFNTNQELIEQYVHQTGIENSISNNVIRTSYEDENGNIWIGTYDKLNLLERKKKNIRRFNLQQSDSLSQNNNLILDIKPFNALDDHLLIGTETGLCLFNTRTYQFTRYKHSKNNNSISNSVVKTICVVDNEAWLGTDLGLNKLDWGANKFTNYFYEAKSSFSISSNVVNDIYLDKNRNLWVATDSGIDKVFLNTEDILLQQFYPNSAYFNKSAEINNISNKVDDKVWIASHQGAFHFDSISNMFQQYLPPSILHNKVNDILYGNEGKVWIATLGGINIYDSKKDQFSNFVARSEGTNVLTTNYITTLAQDSKSNIWLGTANKGLFKVNEGTDSQLEFINFPNRTSTNSISSNSINDLVFDEEDNLWIATGEGLNCFYTLNGVFERFTDVSRFGDISSRTINQLFFDEKKTLWISTDNGIYKKETKKDKFERVATIQELSRISSTVSVGSNLYFISERKLWNLNLLNNTLVRIPNHKFGLKSLKKIKLFNKETLVLFGSKGFSTLNIKDLIINNNEAKVIWTGLTINDVEINPYTKFNSRYIIDKRIDNIDKLVLNYDENSFKINFSSLAFNSKKDIEYTYILEDYQDNWSLLKNGQNYASFTKVRPGNYQLKVKASNSQGVYSQDERILSIKVNPPLYLSSFALLVYFILFGLLIFYYRYILIQRERDRSELKIEKLNHQKSEELIALKTRFFTNITHELKTPLTLISSPVDDLLNKPLDDSTKRSLTLVKKNADRLRRLVNQILDIRKIESGGEKLKIQEYDIIKFTKQVISQFKGQSLKRNIYLQFKHHRNSMIVWFDQEKLEKVLFNLLSNAFKFTPDDGLIKVRISKSPKNNNQFYQICVSDSGSGIDKEEQDKIFERFSSLSSKNYSNQKGTGIGMSVILEYVKLHNGTIKLKSELNKGSEFTIYFQNTNHNLIIMRLLRLLQAKKLIN